MIWENERAGKFTASEIWKLFVEPRSKADKEKGIFGETAESYILEKAIERITGYRKKFFSKEMEHGVINEKDAFDAFVKQIREQRIIPGGIDGTWEFTNKQFFGLNNNSGASPDGVYYAGIDPIAVVDVKCPQPITFFNVKKEYLETGECPDKNYYYQLQMQMLATKTQISFLYYYLAEEFGDTWTGETDFKFDLPLDQRSILVVVVENKSVQNEIINRIARAEERCQYFINLINGKK